MKLQKNTENHREIKITGKSYIKYIDNYQNAQKGDILFLLNDDSVAKIVGDYENLTLSGYFKAKIFDGREWHFLNLEEFFENKEYKFSKKERSIDVVRYCADLFLKFKDEHVYRIYRAHFTRHKYEEVEYIKKSQNKEIKRAQKSKEKNNKFNSNV